ncbi:MAG: formate dehydrogenase [Hydrocarboniphaga sp.]|uniref:molybdopterin-containing oxidoreductase family protein n=1 Tax=Hydrocarboniphaga sp. TaxID=2033016 RepID=UPI00262C81F5|nr:molybdopterin-dependent oxidoreductase [Hydrocarboniphaga sp.]MDB5970134.1 formate dehydrogenase [Hydrocarboniphaga sp.]
MIRTVFTHCHYCVCLCGVKVTVDNDEVTSIEPDRDNPYTWSDFCRKGKTAAETRKHPQRLMSPMKRVGERYVAATYEEAIADIASRLKRIIAEHGADAVGTYHGNPLGFSFAGSIFFAGLLDALGTGNRYWVGSVDQNNTHVVQQAMYGSELIAMPPDIDECKCFLLVGMDPAQSKFGWTEVVPNGWTRVLNAQAGGADVIVVDPRRSNSAERANTHLAVLPGQDWALLLGLLHVTFEERLERPATAVPLSGVGTLRSLALEADLEDLSARCGIPVPVIRDVARRFAKAPRAMCVMHTGVAHNLTGTIAEWLGNALNAVTDRLDTPGGRRFESGYMDLVKIFAGFAPPTTHRTRLRNLPAIAGFHALAELADEIITPGKGQIRAMIVAAGNPVVSGPDSAALDQAFAGLDLLVAVDTVQRESHRHAHWLIPGTHWLEREGLHALFAGIMDKPFAQYANQALPPPAGIREEWSFFTDLALAMDRPMFGKRGVNGFIRATRWLAHVTGRPQLAMNPRWVEWLLVASGRQLKYGDIRKHPHGWLYREKRYGDLAAAIRTPDKTVHCAPPAFVDECRRHLAEPRSLANPEFPLMMINRRTRESMNSWLNETPGLFEQLRSNSVEIHPQDAATLQLEDGAWTRVISATGAIELPVTISPGARPGVITIAHGWGSRIFDPGETLKAQSFGANRNKLVARTLLDPLSQTPAFNTTRVRLEPLHASAQVTMHASTSEEAAVS